MMTLPKETDPTDLTSMTLQSIPFLDLSETSARFGTKLEEAAARVVRSGRYLHGAETHRLEERLAAMCGARFAIGVSNGLDALRLIFRGYIEIGRLHRGQEVLVPATTYIASILPLVEFGLKPVLVEPDEATMSLDWIKALDMAGPETGALLTVHLYGIPSWDADIARELHRRGILIVEDNAQAIGAEAAGPGLNGSRICGGLGDAAAFSFYPTKNIGALGDAGAVVTSDRELAEMVRVLANYGSDRRYHNIVCGYNCRIDEIQSALLNVKLDAMAEDIAMRRRAAEVYLREIRHPELLLPHPPAGTQTVWHQFVVRSAERDRLAQELKEAGVGTDIHYATPPHLQPCLADLQHEPLPLTEKLASEVLSLPIANISPETASEISRRINASFQGNTSKP